MDASGGLQQLAGRLMTLESSVSEYQKQISILSDRCALYAADRDAAISRLRSRDTQYEKLAAAARSLAATLKPEGDEEGSKLLEALNKLL